MPFEFDKLPEKDQRRLYNLLKVGPDDPDLAMVRRSWDKIVEFLLEDPRGQYIGLVLAAYIRRTVTGPIKIGCDPQYPQIILVGHEPYPDGRGHPITAIFGQSGQEGEFKVFKYAPGSPQLMRDAIDFFKGYWKLLQGRQAAKTKQAGVQTGKRG